MPFKQNNQLSKYSEKRDLARIFKVAFFVDGTHKILSNKEKKKQKGTRHNQSRKLTNNESCPRNKIHADAFPIEIDGCTRSKKLSSGLADISHFV